MFDRLRRDLDRFRTMESDDGSSLIATLRTLLFAPQLQAIAVHRFGHWVTAELKGKAVRLPLTALYYAADYVTQAMWSMHIHPGADIGGGLYLAHAGSLLIGPVKMGEDCCVGINVVMGGRTDGRGGGRYPTIGDRVWIGSGCVLYGGVEIGSGATVGALTAVGRDVAARSLVCGSPMKVLRADYDNTYEIYGASPPADAVKSGNGPGNLPKPDQEPQPQGES